MKRFLLSALLTLACAGTAAAQTFVNLTPRPKQMTAGEGELVLPADFRVGYGTLPDSLSAEAVKFVRAVNAATGFSGTAVAGEGLISMSLDATAADEGYTLDVTTGGVSVKARTSRGFYYAFQTLRKILPANVMAGVRDEAVSRYALPVVSIKDEPRFSHRGFMLDVARHFFSVEEVKRMIDVMSYYKMSRFHWHLTDDQGWRVEIKKYPKLTTVGSIAPNCYATSLEYGPYYTNSTYGPYFYTQDEIREVVAYAAERHIDVIPEVDMPGHFVAAMASYPEYSCSPNGGHTIWFNGGISSDVLNVGNPAAVQFAKDILAELVELFPYPVFHIGGDECPTSAWEGNAECQARYRELGLTNYRQLQSHFIKDMADFLAEKGKRIAVWNEAITASGADVNLIKSTNAIVWSWMPAEAGAKQAAELGLDNVFTKWGPYYINRKQSNDWGESTLPGDGSDNVRATYNLEAVPSGISSTLQKHYTGVQGTFWTEHIADSEVMEYMALPRLIAVAEAGWTPASLKNFDNFCQRITADTALLDYNGYHYARHFISSGATATDEKVMPVSSTADYKFWYRVVSKGTSPRTGRCMELLRAASPLLDTYKNNGAAEGRLWTNEQAAEGTDAYDWQLWAFEENPAAPGTYALVCKAAPEGSVNPDPSAQGTGGRWSYSATTKHYNFVLGDNAYGKNDDSGTYYYSMRSDKLTGLWMNASLAGQGFSVNVYNNPSDGNGGLWTLAPVDEMPDTQTLDELLAEVRGMLSTARTYEGTTARPGKFGEAETAALQALVKDADPSTMSAGQLADFTTSLTAAYDAFRASLGMLEAGKTYRVSNAVEGFGATALSDAGTGANLRHSTDRWADDAWEVTAASTADGLSQTVRLRNVATGRTIGAPASAQSGHVAYPVAIGSTAADLLLSYNAATADFTLSSNGKNLFPVPETSLTLPGIVSSGSSISERNATRPMGAAWNADPVCVITYVCRDEQGADLGTFRQSAVLGEAYTCTAPAITNYEVTAYDDSESAEAPVIGSVSEARTVNVTYRRSAYTIRLVCRDQHGALISTSETSCPVGEAYTAVYPEHPYYTYADTDLEGASTFTPEADLTITATYTTDAFNGVRTLAGAVSALESGKSYVIYDTSPAATERIGYRNVDPSTHQVMQATNAEDATPYFTWLFEKSGQGFKVKNEYTGLYIPQLTQSGKIILSKNGDTFRFTLNADGETWKVQGSNNQWWDGLAGSFTGWHTYGHPYKFYEYYVQPYFTVTVNSLDTDGASLGSTTALIKAGDNHVLTVPALDGYTVERIENADQLQGVASHVTVSVVYKKNVPDGIDTIGQETRPNSIYDLSGRRVSRINGRGVYIIDGQKVYVK